MAVSPTSCVLGLLVMVMVRVNQKGTLGRCAGALRSVQYLEQEKWTEAWEQVYKENVWLETREAEDVGS